MLTFDLAAAEAHLRYADPLLARVIDAVGPCTLQPGCGAYRMLARSVFFQQLAGAAARAILLRVLAVTGANAEGFFTPAQFLAAPDDALRAAGLSRPKLAYLRDLSLKFATGELRDDELEALDDEEIILRVTAVKGIGRWTAEMFLIFGLARPDVLPVDDLGVRRGFQRVYGLPALPAPDAMRRLAEPWQPYRTVGAWYLWRSGEVALPAG